MSPTAVVLKVLAFAVSTYSFLCVARIFLAWFPHASGTGARMLVRLTEPWLAPFRRISLFRGGGMDFSPVAALAVLTGVSRALMIASYGVLTLGIALSLFAQAVLEPLLFIIGFFAVLVLARIVAYLFKWNSLHPLWRAVDALINPIMFSIKRLLYKDRIVNYLQGLVVGCALLAAARFGLGWLAGMLYRVLAAL